MDKDEREVKETIEEEEKESRELENVPGGYIFYAGDRAGDKERPYEVIDENDGHVIARFSNFAGAEEFSRKHGYSTKRIWWWGVLAKRRQGWPFNRL